MKKNSSHKILSYYKDYTVFLGSSSPRRKEILQRIFSDITVIKPHIDESEKKGETPLKYLKRICSEKLTTTIEQLPTDAYQKKFMTICADTIVVNEAILQKPKNSSEALAMLKSLCGKTHKVITAVAFAVYNIDTYYHYFYDSAAVTFGNADDLLLKKYINDNNVYDKAGGYGIQDDLASLFIQKINGNYDTVMGFPLYMFYDKLLKH